MDRGEKTTMFSGQVSCGMSDKGTDMSVAVGDATANGYIRKRHVSLRRACQHSAILFNSLHIGSDSQVLYLSTVI